MDKALTAVSDFFQSCRYQIFESNCETCLRNSGWLKWKKFCKKKPSQQIERRATGSPTRRLKQMWAQSQILGSLIRGFSGNKRLTENCWLKRESERLLFENRPSWIIYNREVNINLICNQWLTNSHLKHQDDISIFRKIYNENEPKIPSTERQHREGQSVWTIKIWFKGIW